MAEDLRIVVSTHNDMKSLKLDGYLLHLMKYPFDFRHTMHFDYGQLFIGLNDMDFLPSNIREIIMVDYDT